MATYKGIPLSKISPAFLHANSTSHTWPFSAIAELIDNAYDPDVAASELYIDKASIRGNPCLIIQDNGSGMDLDHLLKMLSFGFCEKDAYEAQANHLPIGHYGNGFKSGSMRLAKDAIVFTVCKKSASVGYLSQTYLEQIKADSVIVPMIEYRLPSFERIKSQESRNNLEAILKYSPYTNEKDIQAELKLLYNRSRTGTKIVLYKLKRLKNGNLELDFESDSQDIRNPEAHEVDLTSVYHRTSHVETSEYVKSLRVYCSILFLRPRMKIFIRGIKVKNRLITKSLSHTEKDVYKPTWLAQPLQIVFGFNCKKSIATQEDYGVMFYHRNRLIKAYEKLGYQKQANDLGVGVVGVVQVDCLKPIHNKQDFQKDEKYNAIMSSIGLKLNDYWNEKNGTNLRPTLPRYLPDWTWAQCDRCMKWRRLPDSAPKDLPDQWFCHMNPDPTHNRCDIPEEPEDEDKAVQRPTYKKKFKKLQEEKKRLSMADILVREKILQAREAELERLERECQQQLNEVSSSQQNMHNMDNLKKELFEAKKREEAQKRLLLRLQTQKKSVEDQRNSLMVAAHNLQTSKTSAGELLEVVSAIDSDQSPVSSTSGRISKRKSTEPFNSSTSKRINITTETGETLSITRNFSEEEDTSSTGFPADADLNDELAGVSLKKQSVNSCTSSKTTSSSAQANGITSYCAPSPGTETASDIEIVCVSASQQGTRCSQTHSSLTPSSSAEPVIDLTEEPSLSTDQDIKPIIDEIDELIGSSSCHGAPLIKDENNASGTEPGTGSGQKMKCYKETKYTQLAEKHSILQQRFKKLQHNIYRLLSFIVPDVDLGTEEDIEMIVLEMIRVNSGETG